MTEFRAAAVGATKLPDRNLADHPPVLVGMSAAMDRLRTDVVRAAALDTPVLITGEPGSGKSLPRNLLWACGRAEGKSRDIVAAWLVELKSTDPKRKSLVIGFPAYPKIEDCQSFRGVVFSRLDPATDRIERQKVEVTLLDAEITDRAITVAFGLAVMVMGSLFISRAFGVYLW